MDAKSNQALIELAEEMSKKRQEFEAQKNPQESWMTISNGYLSVGDRRIPILGSIGESSEKNLTVDRLTTK